MRSTSSPESVLVALGSNLGDRTRNLRRAVGALREVISVVRVSSMHETEPVDAPIGSPLFLNMVVAGYTTLSPEDLLRTLQEIEQRHGRVRRGRNAPRTIDIDLILHSANLRRSPDLTLPHPRYLQREFVMAPLRELHLAWFDPVSGKKLGG
ncbi:MAG TPA: 2-amino-4-hydroxy-6-hydroxymethyldihydropteridine diphosphokinase [Thermoanaerobaculia bacterium]